MKIASLALRLSRINNSRLPLIFYRYHMKTSVTSPTSRHGPIKRAKTWDSKELCQLLSDSDGWDDLVDTPVKQPVKSPGQSEFGNSPYQVKDQDEDDDDDILLLSENWVQKRDKTCDINSAHRVNSVPQTKDTSLSSDHTKQLNGFLGRDSSKRDPTLELPRTGFFELAEPKPVEDALRARSIQTVQDAATEQYLKCEEEGLFGADFNRPTAGTQLSTSPSFEDPVCPPLSLSMEEEEEESNVVSGRKRSSMRSKNHELVFLTQKAEREDSEELASRTSSTLNKKLVQGLVLSEEQESVIELAKEHYNIFYTGSAGTGKSVLLRVLIKTLRRMYGPGSVAVTASTGLAACNIGGITVHSFAGFGLGNGDSKMLLKKVRRSKKHVKRWTSIKALVIDEVSMIDGDLLDKLDHVARSLRKDQSPFGGIQIILSGDFFQLPPVNKNQSVETKFAFHANAWKEAIDATIMLQKVFRQQGDSEFVEMLNEMRMGKISPETELEFKKLCRPLPDDDIIPAELYSTRNEVERANMSRLKNLPGECHTYHAIDGGDMRDQETKEKLLSNFLAPKELRLKVGAQVMMIKNIDDTLVNGSLGKIIDFIDKDTYMFYERVRNYPDIDIEELELMRQGKIPIGESSEEEEMNQRVIRKKTLKESFCGTEAIITGERLGESIFDFLLGDFDKLSASQKLNIERKKKLLEEVQSSSSGRKLPLVRFLTPDGTSRCVLVQPEDWAVEDEQQKPIVSRVQLPLMLAWALSIHKSQGQTLPKVKVDLRRIFEKGQAYVALSRAVSRDGLQVLNFNKAKVQAHSSVMDFYRTLTSAHEAKKRFSNAKGKQQALSFPQRAVQPAKRTSSKTKEERQDRITSMLMRKNKSSIAAAKLKETGLLSSFGYQNGLRDDQNQDP
ncbi:LAQU0S01e00936g1_1 [Lachancea quebecensis]|uniref:ATP-dependent DNA helicase PIF1 n=1 Tax=Lachancea quebecensis TaxID=1654605 RepID=A0A0P1KKU7_9SACH|nr:LAQU0S01e00936g1_1 [Lachancea quebecensis]